MMYTSSICKLLSNNDFLRVEGQKLLLAMNHNPGGFMKVRLCRTKMVLKVMALRDRNNLIVGSHGGIKLFCTYHHIPYSFANVDGECDDCLADLEAHFIMNSVSFWNFYCINTNL